MYAYGYDHMFPPRVYKPIFSYTYIYICKSWIFVNVLYLYISYIFKVFTHKTLITYTKRTGKKTKKFVIFEIILSIFENTNFLIKMQKII